MPPEITDPQDVQVANVAPATPEPVAPTPPATPAATPEPAPQPTPSFLDSLRAAGVQLPANNEQEAIQALAKTWQEHQQLQRLAPAAQAYVQDRDQYTAWKRAQEEEARKKQAEQPKPWWNQYWNPPEYNPAWQTMVRQDENGNLVPVPGAPIGVVEKVQQYQAYRREMADKLMSNPFQFFEEPVKHLATQVAQEMVQKNLQQYRDQMSAREFVNRESQWLYEHDQNGQRRFQSVVNPQTGSLEQQPVLSPLGQKLRDYVTEEARRQQSRGYYDLEEQQRNAMTRVQLDYALQQLEAKNNPQAPAPTVATPPPNPREATNAAFLKNQGPAARPATPPSVAPPTQPRRDLTELLRERFKQNGITDDNFVTTLR